MRAEVVVVGAGVVGLAIAARLARHREVLVLERMPRAGQGISSRSSEVIHAGLYYPENSLKSRLCIEGRDRLYRYCEARGVPHRRIGKWLVAVEPGEREALAALQQRARECGAGELPWWEGGALTEREPALRASAALLSSDTGIVDATALMLSLQAEIEAHGGQMVCLTEVLGAEPRAGGFRLRLSSAGEPAELDCGWLVNAAGLGAQSLAACIEGLPASCIPPLRLCKGHYFSLQGASPFSRLVYPLPEANTAGLGVHATLDLAGHTRFGPDVDYVDQEGYAVDEARREAFAQAIRRYYPGLEASRLQPAYAGVRPKLSAAGEPARDFELQGEAVHGIPGLLNLFGIESPGLTASLALARQVEHMLAG